MSINKAVISGNLGGDPELRVTSKGASVLTFSVAVNDRVPDGNGGWRDSVNWIKVTVFGNRADGLSRVLSKGMKVCVSGRLKQETWEKNGYKHSTVSLTADDVDFMSMNGSSSGSHDAPAPEAVPDSVYDADIPF